MTKQTHRVWLVHLLRLTMLAAIVGLIHVQHQRRMAEAKTASLESVSPDLLESLYGKFTAIGEPHPVPGARWVVGPDNDTRGYVLQSSPDGDHAMGFSGPTNVLIAFDPDDRLVGLRILDSGDTREHVRIVDDSAVFQTTFEGAEWDEVSQGKSRAVDAVSGATLTSLAATEAVVTRLGGQRPSLRFPNAPQAEQVRRAIPSFEPSIASLRPGDVPWTYEIRDAKGNSTGTLLRSVPAGDQIIGYQGPTEVWIAVARDGAIQGIGVGHSYDNETYVDYVREDAYFRTIFNDVQIKELADVDLDEARVEGVSGATMTSLAVAESAIATARATMDAREAAAKLIGTPQGDPNAMATLLAWPNLLACLVIVLGVTISLTRLRGRRWLTTTYQVALIGFLGFAHGDLLSQAMLVGWSQHGIPWSRAPSLALLTVAAFALPVATRRNVYCTHLCAHGAVQQWLARLSPWRIRVHPRIGRFLSLIPGLLLAWVVAVATFGWSVSLVGIEPFDAYVFWVAGGATIAVAVIGLVFSLFTPMAYCRYGCPTGALLGYVRRHRRTDRWNRRDWLVLALLTLAFIGGS